MNRFGVAGEPQSSPSHRGIVSYIISQKHQIHFTTPPHFSASAVLAERSTRASHRLEQGNFYPRGYGDSDCDLLGNYVLPRDAVVFGDPFSKSALPADLQGRI